MSSEPSPTAEPQLGGAEWRGAAGGSGRRAVVLGVVLAVLVVAGLVDGVGPAPVVERTPLVQPVPVAAPARALSSSWFCAGATNPRSDAKVEPVAPASVVVANSGPQPVTARVRIVSDIGTPVNRSVQVAAFSSMAVPESLPGGGAWVGAVVDVDAGAVAVAQVAVGPLGRSYTPCATSGSSRWYFAAGSTLINSDTEISLLNPYPVESIVDLSFSTDQGVEAPQEFQGLDVPAGGLVSIDLRDHLRRRQYIATTVSARTGSLVAWKTDWTEPPKPGAVMAGTAAASNPLADPAAAVAGMSITLGAPSAGTRWVWPDGLTGNGIDERYAIYNPGPSSATIRLAVDLQQGSAEPFDLTVGPYQVLQVVSSQQARIPAGVAHAAVLNSLNGVAVVAERTMVASGGAAPTARWGRAELLGLRVAAAQWLVPATAASGSDAWITVYNPGTGATQVSVDALGSGGEHPAGPDAIYGVGSEGRLSVPISPSATGRPLLVSAGGPVYVEYDLYGSARAGTSMSSGVPLRP